MGRPADLRALAGNVDSFGCPRKNWRAGRVAPTVLRSTVSSPHHVAPYRARSLPSAVNRARTGATVEHSLATARDAISSAMRVLTLAGDRSPRHIRRHADCAQALLTQAATALAESAVYVVGLRTFTTDVILSAHADPRAELQRLHHLATQLWWHNSPRFPGDEIESSVDDDALAAMMWAYSIESPVDAYVNIAKATAGLTLIALGVTVSPPAAIVCAAALGAGSIIRS